MICIKCNNEEPDREFIKQYKDGVVCTFNTCANCRRAFINIKHAGSDILKVKNSMAGMSVNSSNPLNRKYNKEITELKAGASERK